MQEVSVMWQRILAWLEDKCPELGDFWTDDEEE